MELSKIADMHNLKESSLSSILTINNIVVDPKDVSLEEYVYLFSFMKQSIEQNKKMRNVVSSYVDKISPSNLQEAISMITYIGENNVQVKKNISVSQLCGFYQGIFSPEAVMGLLEMCSSVMKENIDYLEKDGEVYLTISGFAIIASMLPRHQTCIKKVCDNLKNMSYPSVEELYDYAQNELKNLAVSAGMKIRCESNNHELDVDVSFTPPSPTKSTEVPEISSGENAAEWADSYMKKIRSMIKDAGSMSKLDLLKACHALNQNVLTAIAKENNTSLEKIIDNYSNYKNGESTNVMYAIFEDEQLRKSYENYFVKIK